LDRLVNFVKKHRIIERHKNPWGIFLRIPIYLFIFWAIWNHLISLLIIAFGFEICLWLLIPPVTETLSFIEKIIQIEILWAKARLDVLKILSVTIFIFAVLAIITGLWTHNRLSIVGGLIGLIVFNLLMKGVAKSGTKS